MPSFREMTAWISALVILGFYGNFLLHASEHGDPEVTLGGLAGTVIAIIVVEVTLIIILAITSPRADQRVDERDRLIDAKAYRNAYFVLASGIFFATAYSLVPELASIVESLNLPPSTALAHMLVASFVAAELMHFGSLIVYYRAGV